MEKLINGQELQRIWLMDEKNKHTILKSKIIVTDDNLLENLLNELEDDENYETVLSFYESGLSKECQEGSDYCWRREPFGKVLFQNLKGLGKRANKHKVCCFINSKNKVYQLITNNPSFDGDLLSLFEKANLSKVDLLEELENINMIIKELNSSSIHWITVIDIIEKMWPNFGAFATELMDCIDFQTIDKYEINIDNLYDICNRKSNYCSKIKEDAYIKIEQYELAQGNSKVLSLARQVNQISKNNM